MKYQERKIIIDTGSFLKIIGIMLVLGFLYIVRDIVMLVFIAIFLATLIRPAALYFATKKIPKGATVIAIYILLIGLAILGVSLFVPVVFEQGKNVLASVKASWSTISNGVVALQDISLRYGLQDNLQAGISSLESQWTGATVGLFQTVSGVLGGAIGLVIVLVMAFYMVVQEEDARRAFHAFVPRRYQDLLSNILRQVQDKMGRWLVGQLSLGLIIGTLYFIGLTLVGYDSVLVLALVGGFTEFIPYLGPILGAIPVVLIGLGVSPLKALLGLLVVVIIQQIEGHVIVPKVMQRAVGLNPLVSITALLIGAKLFGIVGALLAIPVATAVTVILEEIYRFRQDRDDV